MKVKIMVVKRSLEKNIEIVIQELNLYAIAFALIILLQIIILIKMFI